MLDPNSGAVLASTDGNPALGLRATAGGVWLTQSGGMAASIQFVPTHTRPQPVNLRGAGTSGGGLDVAPTISGGVAWLGGYGSAGCADPDTGRLRARTTHTAGQRGYLSSITVADGQVYALYGLGGRGRLISLRPPAACRVS